MWCISLPIISAEEPKIVCSKCGRVYGRKAHLKRTQKVYWQCYTRSKQGPKFCKNENVNENVNEEVIHRVFIEAWNTVVREQEKLERRWGRMEKKGTELERLRARQMRELVKQGPLTSIVPELVQTVLESIVVKGDGTFEIRFLDGTAFQIKF